MSREAPQGMAWLEAVSGALSALPHRTGVWGPSVCGLTFGGGDGCSGPCPLPLLSPLPRRLLVRAKGMLVPLWWERFQQRSVVMLKWLHSGDSQKSHSPLPGVGHNLKDEPNQPQRSRHWPPSPFLLGPNEKEILIIVPFLARQEVQATCKEMPWLCALESLVFELRGFHFKSEELRTQGA